MRNSMKPVIQKPDVPLKPVCRSCGVPRDTNEYRYFQTHPVVVYMDFCSSCEQKFGTLTLYRRFNAYGTPEVVTAVFAAERTPVARRSEDQVRLLVVPGDAEPP